MPRALIVDDMADSLYFLRVLLQGSGFVVDSARHGAEALALARMNLPDLVISDLLMPVMDGYTLLRHWKADETLRSVPFVVYTATYTDAKDEKLALDLGADAFILKPAEPGPFMQALGEVLDRRRQGALETPKASQLDPASALESYNTALVRKLEKKTQDLEQRVAEREQALAAQRTSELQFRALFDNSLDMMFITSPDGRIYAANPAACRALGLTEAQIRERGRPGVVDPDDDRLAPLLAERAARGVAFGELKFVRADGTRFEVELSSSTYPDARGILRTSTVARDITVRKAAEAARRELDSQLRQAQKMQALGTLAGGIAHDFNNVVGAILGFAALAQQDLPPDAPAQESLAQIRAAADRARGLVQRILSFSRPQPTTLGKLALQTQIGETLALLRVTMPAVVMVETRLAQEPLYVLADSTQLQQVLVNLCTNAWHALGGSSGRIEIGLEAVDMAASDASLRPLGLPPGHFVHLWVRDNGSGMDAATCERIFEPFFTTKPLGQGTGLGLAMVHSIVHAHHGAIAVDSAPGKGSCFHVYLPRVATEGQGDPTAAEVAAPAPGGAPGRRVFYVDDDEIMALVTERFLARKGFKVTRFTDPAQALAALRAEPLACDIVVTDFNMPRMSGLDLARAMLAVRPGLPVLISTGRIEEALRTDAQRLGVFALVNKERILEDMVPAMERALAPRTRADVGAG